MDEDEERSKPPLIPWKEVKDPRTGRKYWYHRTTKETTWINPIPTAVRIIATAEFNKFDSDGGGTISTEELNLALQGMDIHLNEEQLANLIGRYDEDNSGELDVEEWCQLAVDAFSKGGGGRADIGASLQLYAKKMPIADIKKAKGYPDPPTRVTATADEHGAAVWWTPPPERPGCKAPTGYIVRRWRKDGDHWDPKGETEFLHDTRCSQRIEDLKMHDKYRFTVITLNNVGRSEESKESNAVMCDEPLPSGWAQYYDAGNEQHYYVNAKTNQRTWLRPDTDPYYVDTELFLEFTPAEMGKFKELYHELDYDQSGAVNEEELKSILPRIGEMLSIRDVEWLFFKCDEDDSGELDYEEFVKMLLRLKKERMQIIGCCTKMARWRKRKWDYCCRPRIGKKKVKSLQNATGKKMGAWSKHIHPVVGKAYYYNSTTGATKWQMPDEVKFFISDDLSNILMERFTPADIVEFEEKFAQMDLDCSGAIDREELRVILTAMGERITDARLDSLIREVDTDGSGEIDFDEFVMMMSALKGNEGGLTRSWNRLADMDDKTPGLVTDIKQSYKKMVGDQLRRQKKRKNPHGYYCMCGCREYDPEHPPGKGWCYYLCCFGCICLPCCRCCCPMFRQKKHLFPPITKKEMEKKRRQMKLRWNQSRGIAEAGEEKTGVETEARAVTPAARPGSAGNPPQADV
mmetsp:Transcript_10139/g.23785  ORF Transcript_10139/g.23785 Transcript_10139/m.23785 type:complete len:689 (-) Transcript_10139:107-2173(-)